MNENVQFVAQQLKRPPKPETAGFESEESRNRNLSTVQSLIESLSQSDWQGIRSVCAPHVRFEAHTPKEIGFIPIAEGIEAVLEAIAHNFAQIDEQHSVLETVVAQGNEVILLGFETGRVRKTWERFNIAFSIQLRLELGLVVLIREVCAFRADP